jgi:hypothetical protein
VIAGLQATLLAVVIAIYLAGLDGTLKDGALASGDFVAFYTGATLVREGRGADLYDMHAQLARQHALVGEDPGSTQLLYLPYLNPPLLALALAPIASLPYVSAFYAFDVLMLLSFAGAILLLRPVLPRLARSRGAWAATVLLLWGWHPVSRTLFGGQNTVLTFLLLAGLYAAWKREQSLLAGLFLGLLSYKPQYTLVFGLVFLLRREWRVLGVATAVVGVHYALGALVCGPKWPLAMLGTLEELRHTFLSLNAPTHFSLIRSLDYSVGGWPGRAIALALIALAVGVCWRRARTIQPSDPRFGLAWSLLLLTTLLASPHLQFYDAGLLALPVLIGLDTVLQDRSPSLRLRFVLLAAYFAYPIYEYAPQLGFQPLVLWLVGAFLWIRSLLVLPGEDQAGVNPATT